MSTIEVTNLSKSYGDAMALDDISFTTPGGEFIVVLGQSGAGKSTPLRCLNGITRLTSGSIAIDGADAMGPRNGVTVIFQQHYILGQISAYSNMLTGTLSRISFLGNPLDLYDGDDKQETLRALETVGLLDKANQRIGEVSGGQQQRVDITRALIQNPNLLLTDEPVMNLDPANTETVMRHIHDAADECDLTTITNLHQVNIAHEFDERFIGVKNRQIVFDGYREDLDVDVIDHIYGDTETKAIREEQADKPSENNTAATSGAGSHEY